MSVVIFTNTGCGNCEKMKALMNELEVEYEERDAKLSLDPNTDGFFKRNNDWRTNGVVDAMAILQLDHQLPVVIVDNKAYPYQEAAELLTKKHSNKHIHVDFNAVECEDGVCALAV